MLSERDTALANIIIYCFEGDYVSPIIYLQGGLTEKEVDKLYKASKQLSDLCWQEIQKRRRGE
jgi:hypothetical protein